MLLIQIEVNTYLAIYFNQWVWYDNILFYINKYQTSDILYKIGLY